ncbi:hypothetical protein Ga0609869_002198 [Rhodovulum iodosum]|uniref:Uncharacterized protein n=1 Tax=Rhodovulum iodosum TaxID=68291 RepID=A0ABV3XVM9_9RHOB|nr:DUF6639 family protein [Rhodovulum robiginosum]RSK32273.1 hypothetical protein EJA01_13770 [Rhodovulum robiginosum]
MRAVIAASFWLLACGCAVAGALPCSGDPRITVEAERPAIMAAACDAVARARPRLAACHLDQSRPLVIRVVDETQHLDEACLAYYDCRDDSISVSGPDALSRSLKHDSIWARIAPAALFDSLITHELAHAFLDQTECTGVPCYADHEYIAYALQIDGLSPEDRARVLDGHKVRLPVDPMGLNEFTVLSAPGYFAQAAWLHFSAPDNGCAFVEKLIEGTDTLRIPSE